MEKLWTFQENLLQENPRTTCLLISSWVHLFESNWEESYSIIAKPDVQDLTNLHYQDWDQEVNDLPVQAEEERQVWSK